MAYLEMLASLIPLELFTFVGTIIEEILAPIPSPFVMGITGSITRAQGNPLSYLLIITVIGAVGRVVGTSFLYFVSDIAEDIIIGRFGNFIGISHNEVEKIGAKFNGTFKDYFTLTLLRAIPVLPSSPVSVICGVIKLPYKVFAVGTFIGSLFRNLFFLYIGYTGLAATESFARGLDSAENIGKIVFVLILTGGYYYYYRKREKGELFQSKGEGLSAKEKLEYKHVDELPKEESEDLPTVYIFRHGQSEDNKNLTFSGWRDSPLTEEGREQAKILAEKLKDKKIDKLISSPQIRALDTLRIALSLNEQAADLPIEIDERIKERSYGDLQGQNKLELHEKDPEFINRVRRSWDGQPPNGESIAMVYERVKDFSEDLVNEMKEKKINVAISCHGNSIRCFRKYFEGLSNEETAKVETQLGKDYASYVIR